MGKALGRLRNDFSDGGLQRLAQSVGQEFKVKRMSTQVKVSLNVLVVYCLELLVRIKAMKTQISAESWKRRAWRWGLGEKVRNQGWEQTVQWESSWAQSWAGSRDP